MAVDTEITCRQFSKQPADFEHSSLDGVYSDPSCDVSRSTHTFTLLRENAPRLNLITEEIIRLEDASDTLNDKGIKALFQRHKNGNAMGYIIGVEIYDHLEKVMDRFEDVANRISGIVIEQV